MKTDNRSALIQGCLVAMLSGLCVLILLVAMIFGLQESPVTEDILPTNTDEQQETETIEETEPTEKPTSVIEETTLPAPTTTHTPPQKQEAEAQAYQILDSMTQDEKIYQLFIVTPEELTGCKPVVMSGEITRQAIAQYPVGGIVYFSRNIITREQCQTMISNIQSYSKLGLFISVDEEGSKVSRIGKNPEMAMTTFDPMAQIGSSENAEVMAYEVGHTIGIEIAQLGFNLNFAPVADVLSNPANTVIGDRAFSSDPNIAATLVAACVKGYNDSNMLCTLKHFPGHGDTVADSHYGTAITEKTLDQLYECELLPFRAGIDAGAPFVMVGHITVPKISPLPASVSYEVITGLLREELQFDGIIITDAMDMQAITDNYSSGDAAVMALQAGADVILMPDDLPGAVAGIKEALDKGDLTQQQIDEKVLRILKSKIETGIIPVE